MVAEQRKGVAAVIAEGIELDLSLLILRDMIVGEQAAHTVKAAQILPRRGNDRRQHGNEHQKHHQYALQPAAAARRGLGAADLLADILFLSSVSH